MIPGPSILRRIAAVALSVLATGSGAPAAEPDRAAANANAATAARYEALWTNSPFTRPLNAAESYVLTSVTRIDGKPVVTLLNTETGERFMLTDEKNPLGWSLVDLRPDPDPRNVMARVNINGEEMGVRFHDGQLGIAALMKAADGPRPGASRQRPSPNAPGKQASGKKPGNGKQKNQKKQDGKNRASRQK